jgi:hypothetical protein
LKNFYIQGTELLYYLGVQKMSSSNQQCKSKVIIACYLVVKDFLILVAGLWLVVKSSCCSNFIKADFGAGIGYVIFGCFGLILIITSLIATSSICKCFFEKDEE